MATFRVWAPGSESVAVALGDQRIPMGAQGAGWWVVDVDSARAGQDYGFSLDGGAPLPDPRSPWQPAGVHAASRLVDHHAFPWTDARWQAPSLSAALIYELHVGTFTAAGTFEAAIDRLDHLVHLGITHVELMPVAEFSGTRGWGYDGVDLFAPHHAYGGPTGLKRLVDACHARGLAVLLDVVYNHLGPIGNYLGRFGPYFTSRYATPWGEAVNFDGRGSDEVRRFVFDSALAWLRDYHVDGLRVDAAHAIFDRSALPVLEELAAEVRGLEASLGRRLSLIAESDLNDPRVVRPSAIGGYGFDAQWNEDFHHALHAVLSGERTGYYGDFGRIGDLATALSAAFVYAGRYSAYRGRRHGRPTAGLGGHAFIGCLQNHDQVGNRARGDRTSQLLSPGRLKIGAALVLTAPFVPMLFQGEEWGASTPFLYFTDHEDPELGRAVSEGRRREFVALRLGPGRDPRSAGPGDVRALQAGLARAEPRAPRGDPRVASVASSSCDAANRISPTGASTEVRVAFDERDEWLVMTRGSITLACNLASRPRRVPLGPGLPRECLLASEPGIGLAAAFDMPAESVLILGPRAAAARSTS